MTPLLPSVVIGSLSSGAYLLAQLNQQTTIPVGEAIGGFVFVAGLVWWLGRKLQTIEDDLRTMKDDLANRPCQLNEGCPVPLKK